MELSEATWHLRQVLKQVLPPWPVVISIRPVAHRRPGRFPPRRSAAAARPLRWTKPSLAVSRERR